MNDAKSICLMTENGAQSLEDTRERKIKMEEVIDARYKQENTIKQACKESK